GLGGHVRPLRLLLAGSLISVLAATSAPGPAAADTGSSRVFEGTVRAVAVDAGHAAGAEGLRTTPMADLEGRLVTLPDGAGGPETGDRVRVTLVTASDGTSSVRSVQRLDPVGAAAGRVGARAVPEPVTGKHTLTVLPVYWSSPDSATRGTLSTLAASTAAYWSAQSGGRLTTTTSVREWARIADPRSCDPTRLAHAALTAHGVAAPVNAFDHVVIYFPARADCGGWAGLGQIDGGLIWDNGGPFVDVVAHEFGHNRGLGHANTATCTEAGARVTLSSTC